MATKSKGMFSGWGLALLAFATIFIAFTAVNLYKSKPSGPTPPEVKTVLSPDSGELVRNKSFTASVNITGKDYASILAADIRFRYDKNYFKIVSVKPGGFYSKSLTVKFDYTNNSFALALDPSVKTNSNAIDPTKPLLQVEVMPLKTSIDLVSFRLDETSEYYVTTTKSGTSPTTFESKFTINAR